MSRRFLNFQFSYLCTYQCYPGGGKGGGRAGGGDFDKAFMPEGVAFDFMDSPQGADRSIYSRKTGYKLFCFKMAAIADVVIQEEEVCNLIKSMRSSIHPSYLYDNGMETNHFYCCNYRYLSRPRAVCQI